MLKKISVLLVLLTLTQTNANALGREDQAYQLPIPASLKGSLQNPAFSPDGESIVFTRFKDGYNNGKSSIHTYNLETGVLSTLVDIDPVKPSHNVNLPGSSWNVHQEAIVFSAASQATDEHDEIFMIDDAGTTGNEIQITSQVNKQSYEPTFSPNGQWVLFETHDAVKDRDGNVIEYKENDGVITKLQIGGSNYITLTSGSIDARQPNWSPDGNRILYQEKVGDAWVIRIMDSDGNDPFTVSLNNEDATDAVFSYDGNWIIYSAAVTGDASANIFKKPSMSGGERTQITTYKGYDGAPSISPDSGKIVFESAESSGQDTKIWLINVTN
ncbi:MAG: PD40 domain-containing protein [Methylococcales bacterium]|nr:PD40 domain-containing protein [Methylococcales bacterium]